jgi:hypothetical protein
MKLREYLKENRWTEDDTANINFITNNMYSAMMTSAKEKGYVISDRNKEATLKDLKSVFDKHIDWK